MKATELMIGDLIMSYDVPLRVIGLSRKITKYDPIYVEKVNHTEPKELNDEYWTTEDEVFGIHLTSEILEKNGFVYEYDYGSFYRSLWGNIASDHYVRIGWNSAREVYQYEVVTSFGDGIRSKRTAYGNTAIAVHELQHALRLCGLNELADNFKI